MVWDVLGLGAELTLSYLSMKALFIISPILCVYLYKVIPSFRNLAQPIIAIIYFLYCYYYTANLNYSYYTAFIQFFMGIVVFFRFSKKSFLISYGIGLILVYCAVQSLQGGRSVADFVELSEIIYGAILPIYFISFVVFFTIKNAELEDDMKSLFFQEIGKNVGFLIHEIKQPIKELMNTTNPNSESVESLNELLETANIIWPSQDQSAVLHTGDVQTNDLISEVLNSYKKYLNYIDVEIIVDPQIPKLYTNKAILKIIIKNIIKNALEEIVNDDLKNSVIKISFTRNQKNLYFVISNSIKVGKKVPLKKIFDAGFSGKNGAANKGIGLFITKQLAQRITCSLEATQTHDTFSMELSFPSSIMLS